MLAGGPGSEKRSAAVQYQIRTGLAPQDELRQWLRGLDKGIGALLKYAEALETHFEGSLVQIQACLVDGSDAMTSALSCVDEMFFDALGTRRSANGCCSGKASRSSPASLRETVCEQGRGHARGHGEGDGLPGRPPGTADSRPQRAAAMDG